MKITKRLLSQTPAKDERPKLRLYSDPFGGHHVQRLVGLSVGGYYIGVFSSSDKARVEKCLETLLQQGGPGK